MCDIGQIKAIVDEAPPVSAKDLLKKMSEQKQDAAPVEMPIIEMPEKVMVPVPAKPKKI